MWSYGLLSGCVGYTCCLNIVALLQAFMLVHSHVHARVNIKQQPAPLVLSTLCFCKSGSASSTPAAASGNSCCLLQAQGFCHRRYLCNYSATLLQGP